jgi:hypothetical protein
MEDSNLRQENSMSPSSQVRYEFDDAQNRVFSGLSAAMAFVAAAMLIASVIGGVAMVLLARSTLASVLVFGPLPVIVAVMAVHLSVAARRFGRIVRSEGNDVGNLMEALAHLTSAFRMQRWLWIVISLAIVVALVTTTTGR